MLIGAARLPSRLLSTVPSQAGHFSTNAARCAELRRANSRCDVRPRLFGADRAPRWS
jgi:hypothetical protein